MLTLGQLLNGNEGRDAVHVAIAPVVAAERMRPGEHVGFMVKGNCELVGPGPGPGSIGIVDPFLMKPVEQGQRFWMFLYPNTIQSLRHEWVHPAFPAVADVVPPKPTKAESEAWLREFVRTSDCPDYDTLIAAASGQDIESPDPEWYGTYRNDGEYLHFSGRDAHGDIPPEFWDHVENVTGKTIPRHDRATSFSCSC